MDSKQELQYFIIGIYCFFVLVLVLGLFIVFKRKLEKSCQKRSPPSSADDPPDYDSVASGSITQGSVNAAFEGSTQDDSDYANYSEEEDVEAARKDTPPVYENPPSYSLV